jgi:lipopolysaccharide biosynthesis glycosyltransferase
MKVAIATVTTNNYVIHVKKLLKSIIKENPWFDLEFYIFINMSVSKEDIEEIESIYNKVIIRVIDANKYAIHEKNSPKFYSIESFNIDADKVIFLDSDLICCRDIKPLIEHECLLGMCRELRRPTFNAGLIMIGKELLEDDTYYKLLSTNYNDVKMYGVDQKLYNLYFQDRIESLPREYNTLVTEVDSTKRHFFLHYIHKPNLKIGKGNLKPELVKKWEMV